MFAIKSCIFGTAIRHSLALKSSFRSPHKTYSTLNFLTKGLINRCNLTQGIKYLNKPQIKFELSSRKIATVVGINKPLNVGIWLGICSSMVYVAIFLGGYTRLTESGLSMVTWKFAFEKLPMNENEWMNEFKQYQEYPEFKLLKSDISLEEFKRIWMIEYIHRNWGRILGLVFFVPAISFWLRGFLAPALKKRVAVFSCLIIAQGLLGWFMVKSGLEDRFHKETDVPRVSQYRLAAHSGLALTLYTGLVWTALDLLLKPEAMTALNAGAKKIRMLAHTCKGLVFLTALSGVFVAGLDAGLVYNSFPKMGDKWIPDDILAISPKLKNVTENPTTVQFDHRILALTTLSAILTTWYFTKKYPLPRRAKLAANALALAAVAQVILGISTLVHYVPTPLAVTHQSGSVFLLTLALWLSHELKMLKYIPK